jgi:hypothetical protein
MNEETKVQFCENLTLEQVKPLVVVGHYCVRRKAWLPGTYSVRTPKSADGMRVEHGIKIRALSKNDRAAKDWYVPGIENRAYAWILRQCVR